MPFHLVKGFFRTRPNPTSGLTLIEVLVVMVIAGILAAISFPAFLSRANAAKQVEAKTLVSSLNRAQVAYYMENGKFSEQIESLVKVHNSHNYEYDIRVDAGNPYVNHYARPRHSQLKAYVGMTAVIQMPSQEVTAQSVICESDSFVPQAPDPTYQLNAIECANGTRNLN